MKKGAPYQGCYGKYTMNESKCQVLCDKSRSGRVRPWAVQKLNAEYIALAYEDINPAKAKRIRDCASWLSYVRGDDGSMKLHDARFCRVRLCPICQWRRSLKTYAQMSQVLDVAKSQGFEFLFLTLTMRNCRPSELSSALDKLLGAFNRLTKYKRVKGAIKGFYRGCEVTHNQELDTYHPHLHVVLAVRPSYFKKAYISQADWSALWARALGVEYTPIVDIRRCRGGAKAIAEACKYAVKPGDIINVDDWVMTVDTLRILDVALDRRRFVGLGGVLKEIHNQLQLDDMDTGDLLHMSDDEETKPTGEEIVFWWNGYARRYERD